MVVDDDLDIIESITLILESAGYDVIPSGSSEECLEILTTEKPDLIVLDVMMETMTDGFNLGYTLKNDPKFKTIPIIIVSSIVKHTGFPVDKDFIQVDEFLEKPLEPKVLRDTIAKYIKKEINCR